MKIKKIVQASFAMAALLPLAGCVSGGTGAGGTALRQSAYSVYRCGSDGRLSVRHLSGAIEVLSPRGVEVHLPASPPGQTARYGEPPYALVFDNREALWFVTGKRPISCKR